MRRPQRKMCKDCPPGSKRRAVYAGPRCATHHRLVQKSRKLTAWERRLWDIYKITSEQYWELYERQGGMCYICQRARGTGRKKLSVDHDHACCNSPTSCGKCVRGLLCTTDNKWLGHIRDDAAAAKRVVAYLASPPGRNLTYTRRLK